jgi:Cytosol aminopeptidase family, N-terminal domain
VELRFTTPELRKLDLLGTEVIVSTLACDERPPHGLTGLLDFRLASRISRLIQRGLATGKVGEVLLMPGKPKLPFDKILLFGIGKQSEFNDPLFRSVVDKILRTLEGLRAQSAVVELPGRKFDAISPERAADILLESAGGAKEHDVWTLVEPLDAQRAITQHMIQERRRVRQA